MTRAITAPEPDDDALADVYALLIRAGAERRARLEAERSRAAEEEQSDDDERKGGEGETLAD